MLRRATPFCFYAMNLIGIHEIVNLNKNGFPHRPRIPCVRNSNSITLLRRQAVSSPCDPSHNNNVKKNGPHPATMFAAKRIHMQIPICFEWFPQLHSDDSYGSLSRVLTTSYGSLSRIDSYGSLSRIDSYGSLFSGTSFGTRQARRLQTIAPNHIARYKLWHKTREISSFERTGFEGDGPPSPDASSLAPMQCIGCTTTKEKKHGAAHEALPRDARLEADLNQRP